VKILCSRGTDKLLFKCITDEGKIHLYYNSGNCSIYKFSKWLDPELDALASNDFYYGIDIPSSDLQQVVDVYNIGVEELDGEDFITKDDLGNAIVKYKF